MAIKNEFLGDPQGFGHEKNRFFLNFVRSQAFGQNLLQQHLKVQQMSVAMATASCCYDAYVAQNGSKWQF